MTQIVRLTVTEPIELAKSVENECNVRAAADYWLASSFVVGTDLILIFQKKT